MHQTSRISGYSVLTSCFLALAIGRHALEYDRNRGLLYTLVMAGFLLLRIFADRFGRPRVQQTINVLTIALIASYPFISSLYSQVMTPAIWAYLLFVVALATFVFDVWVYLSLPLNVKSNHSTSEHRRSKLQKILYQDDMPFSLRFWKVVPLTAVGIIVFGMSLALPVGPLSDEGMILFMEGGCDWGNSNIFFFSKLGLLLSVNACFLIALREKFADLNRLVPHLIFLAVLSFIWWNDQSCDAFYGHPQGNLSQMVVEVGALALLMMAMLPRLIALSPSKQLASVCVLNLWYVAAFYFALKFFPHWSWSHSFLVSFFMLLSSVAVFYPCSSKKSRSTV